MAKRKAGSPMNDGGPASTKGGRKTLLEGHADQLQHILDVVALGSPFGAACRSAKLDQGRVKKLLREGSAPGSPPGKKEYATKFYEAQRAWFQRALATIDRNCNRGDSKSIFRLLTTRHPEFRDEKIQKEIRDLRYRVNDLASKLLGKFEGVEGGSENGQG
jgi:hypothetical protein